MSNPSLAAIRAAKKISTLTSSTDPEWSDLYSIEQVAQIIERETALPELIEACKHGEQSLKDIIGAADNKQPYSREELYDFFISELEIMRAAIAKAEGK